MVLFLKKQKGGIIMKRFSKCLITLVLVTVLFSIPFTTYASTWQCTLDCSSGDVTYKEFAYSPPLFINVGQMAGLPNNANSGGFFVKSGQKIVVSVMFSSVCSCNITLVNQSTGKFINDSYYNFLGNSTQLSTIVSETGYYVPIIQAQNSPIPEIPSLTNVQSYIVYVE